MPRKTRANNTAIGRELEKIRKADPDKVLRPEAVVGFAQKNKNSALHAEFNWNVKEAAYQYWLNQARTIIRVNVEVIERTNGETVQVSVSEYISLPDHRGMGYERVSDVISDEERRAAMLRYTIERLLAIKEMNLFPELHDIAEAIQDAADKYLPKQNRRRPNEPMMAT